MVCKVSEKAVRSITQLTDPQSLPIKYKCENGYVCWEAAVTENNRNDTRIAAKVRARTASSLSLLDLIDSSYTDYTMHSIFDFGHRLIKPRHVPSKLVHQQCNASYLPGRPPSLHPTQLLKQLLRFAFPS
jgi:hypothetical protein